MSYSQIGGFEKGIYDCCNYSQRLKQSTQPLSYQLYFGQAENDNRCIYKKRWYRQDKKIVDVESDLMNIDRVLSKCDKYKYNPNINKSNNISTFDSDAPVVLSQNLCPIVYNNIPIQTNNGLGRLTNFENLCSEKNNNYVDSYKKIEQSKMNVFLNTCSNKPLYNSTYQNSINPTTFMSMDYSDYGNA